MLQDKRGRPQRQPKRSCSRIAHAASDIPCCSRNTYTHAKQEIREESRREAQRSRFREESIDPGSHGKEESDHSDTQGKRPWTRKK